MKTAKKKALHRRKAPKSVAAGSQVQPFVEHLQELRRRIYFIAASVLICGVAIYSIQQHVVSALLKPAQGQHFIYTSPGGGIDFLFRVSLYSALILSTPVIVYNLLGFIEPLMSRESRRFIVWMSLICSVLALFGLAFGYYIGLPAALHFLLHQFTTVQIKPLVTIQSYLSFVMAYMLGSALLFQLPIILVCINRIKPLKPKRLLHYERWAILAAFVLAGLMNPTPNILSQLIVAGPFIIMYQLSILLIAVINRPNKMTDIMKLIEQDRLAQVTREQRARMSQPLNADQTPVRIAKVVPHEETKMTQPPSGSTPISKPEKHKASTFSPARPSYINRRRFMDFVPPVNTIAQEH